MFRPLNDRVFIRYTDELQKTPGGLFIPAVAQEKQRNGRVEAIGENVTQLRVGDTVFFDRYAGTQVNLGDTEYLIIEEKEALGIAVEN